MTIIINSSSDLENAPKSVRERFLRALGLTIHKYQWNGTEWERYQDTTQIERYGLSISDFPNAPMPDLPTYDPEQKELEQRESEVRDQRDTLLRNRVDPIVSNPLRYNDLTTEEQNAIGTYRQDLLDVPQQTGFPNDVIWPDDPMVDEQV